MPRRPPSPSPAPPAGSTAGTALGRSEFVIEVPSNSLTPRGLSLHPRGLVWDGTDIAFDEVTGVAYGVERHRTAIVPAHTGYQMCFWRGEVSDTVEIVCSLFSRWATKHDTQLLFESLVSVVHDRIGTRLCDELVAQMGAGETVRLGRVRLHRSGLVCGRGPVSHELRWDQVAGAEFDSGRVVVHRYSKDGTRPVGQVSMRVANAVLLPDLLHQAAAVFGRSPAAEAPLPVAPRTPGVRHRGFAAASFASA